MNLLSILRSKFTLKITWVFHWVVPLPFKSIGCICCMGSISCVGELFALNTVASAEFKSIGRINLLCGWPFCTDQCVSITIQVNWLHLLCLLHGVNLSNKFAMCVMIATSAASTKTPVCNYYTTWCFYQTEPIWQKKDELKESSIVCSLSEIIESTDIVAGFESCP